jgi:DNA topoisomerase-1
VKLLLDNVKKAEAIYLATDPDREGEAISWHILEVMKKKKAIGKDINIQRVVFHEITKNVIVDALDNSRDLDMNLVKAQQARQALDYLVGFTLSPILWRKLPGSRSAGRVQSVALKILCDRENEIDLFKEQEYWSINADFAYEKKIFPANLIIYDAQKLEKFSIPNKKTAELIKSKLEGLSYSVSNITKKNISRKPVAPFITSTLIQEGARKLNFSAKKTMMIAQKLYEGIKIGNDIAGLITYMRTDSVNISQAAITEIRKFIEAEYGANYVSPKINLYKSKSKNAQEAHEAIRPTSFKMPPKKIRQYLDNDQYRLYEIIWSRSVASQMANVLLESVTVEIATPDQKNVFKAVGSTVIFDGFYRLYQEGKDTEEKKEPLLPSLNKDDKLNLDIIKPNQHFTQPPPRYTEASLVKKMEELGIGRPSTYPIILSILVDREYALINQKRFFPQSRGRLVDAFLGKFFHHYVDYDFTAKLEDDLDLIASGKKTFLDTMSVFWNSFKKTSDDVMEVQNIDVIKKIEDSLMQHIFNCEDENELAKLRVCPGCKKGELGIKAGKFGAFLGCSNYPECSYKKGLFADDQQENTDKIETPIVDEGDTQIYLKKGPYGNYLQQDIDEKAKRVSLPASVKKETLSTEVIKELMQLPRSLGDSKQLGGEVFVKIGKFGPYLECNKKFYSLRSLERIGIQMEDAVEYINNYKPKKRGKK